MKFNMGCGLNKRPGCINVDSAPQSGADEIWDLEQTPWPWPSDCAEEVWFVHSLEHMGADAKVFLAIMQELYRIARPGCRIHIHVPHPRHDNFIGDPTHVRPIIPQMLRLFDRQLNESWRASGAANTPLALYTGVDFKLVETRTMLEEPFASQFNRGELSEAECRQMIQRHNNIVVEYRLILEARKAPSAD
ncbi:MAG TPA: hypothetical protein VF474_04830 [Phenylobacterium sp.]